MVEERLQLLTAEGIPSPNLRSAAEFDAAQACKLAGKHTDARAWLERSHAHRRMGEGGDSPTTRELAGLLAQPLTAAY